MILVTGANGQLGMELRRQLNTSQGSNQIPNLGLGQGLFLSSQELDVTDEGAVVGLTTNKSITAIINCAAYTAVDKAETERSRAEAANIHAPKFLGKLAAELKIPVIHLSTDYVFDGNGHRPYVESDPTRPVNFYGETKLAGERALLEQTDFCAIVRTSWVYASHGKNFLQTMLTLSETRPELKVIFDQIGTPTFAGDLASILLTMVKKMKPGMPRIYHFSNEGVASWYDFAKAIFEIRNLPTQVVPITTAEYPTPAQRPHYSVLNKTLIKSTFDIEIPHWREGLNTCLKQF